MVKSRILVAVALALLLAFVAVRSMTFVAPGTHPLRSLGSVFTAHPTALTDRAMTEIGASAAKSGEVPRSARQSIAAVARKSPLAPEPFLIEGTIAEMGGDGRRAELLFIAARTRDPRSEAARYFLADRFLKTKRILPGLIELSALARLSEKASAPLVPALAAYAKSPERRPELRRFFKLYPATREQTLSLLATDPRNVALVLDLASPPEPGSEPTEWQKRLILALIASGDFAGAEQLWTRFSGVTDRGLLFNPQFRKLPASPPFNWEYSSGSGGVAEASGGGGLNIIYYGREDAQLARQMLRLPAGRYRLSMRVEGDAGGSGLGWSLKCASTGQQFARLPIDAPVDDRISGVIAVPANCPAQWIDLVGQPGETTRTVELTISNLTLARAGVGS